MDAHEGPGEGGERARRDRDAQPRHSGEDMSGEAGGDDLPGTDGGQTIVVEVGGETRELPAEHDYTGDGRPDAAAETADGRVIVFVDTEDNETGGAGPDGRADEAYVVDKRTGRVVGAAHLDPASGQWVEGIDTDGPTAAGSGGSGGEPEPAPGRGSGGPEVVTVEVGGHEMGVAATLDPDGDGDADPGVSDPGSPGGSTGTCGSTGTGGSSGTMTVDLGGETRELPAERDYTGDGRPDAAAETADGRVIVFADTEDNETGGAGPDGRADEAYVVDKQTGRVVGSAHLDPRTGEWVEGGETHGSPAVPAPTDGGVDS